MERTLMARTVKGYKKRRINILLAVDESERDALDELCEEGEGRQDVLRRLIQEAIEKKHADWNARMETLKLTEDEIAHLIEKNRK